MPAGEGLLALPSSLWLLGLNLFLSYLKCTFPSCSANFCITEMPIPSSSQPPAAEDISSLDHLWPWCSAVPIPLPTSEPTDGPGPSPPQSFGLVAQRRPSPSHLCPQSSAGSWQAGLPSLISLSSDWSVGSVSAAQP